VDDFEFCNWLIEEAGVAAVPGSVFFDQSITRFARFHFSKREETLHEAGRRLVSIRQKV
jgi:aminotransferase